jgi:hypothetical protein
MTTDDALLGLGLVLTLAVGSQRRRTCAPRARPPGRHRLALAGGEHPLVETQALADRHLDLPVAAVDPRQAQVGVEPERDRHRGVS